MTDGKKKVYKTLYVRIRVENKEWIEKQVAKNVMLSEASFVDALISTARKIESARKKI